MPKIELTSFYGRNSTVIKNRTVPFSHLLNSIRKEDGQIALILALAFLALLGAIGGSFLYRMRLEQRAASNYQDSVKAHYLAEAGIERAIAELRNDNNEYDDLYESWALGFQETWEEGKYSVYYEEEEESKAKVGIFDEAGKININTAGINTYNDGWTPYEISLAAIETLNKKLSLDVIKAIIAYRYGPDGAPGVKGVDDDKDNSLLQTDGIDNDADGEIDELNEGIDEPDEFRPQQPYGDDNPFDTVEEIRLVPGIGEVIFNEIKDYITIYSYDKNLDKEGKLRININKAPPSKISQTFQEVGIPAEKADQIAVNIVDFRDEDNFPTTYQGKYGIEKTPYINEIMPNFTTSIKVAAKELIKGGIEFLKDKIKGEIRKRIKEKIKGIVPGLLEEEIEKSISSKEEELKKGVERIIEDYQPLKEGNKIITKLFKLLGDKIAHAAEKEPPKKTKIAIEIEWIELFNPYEVPCEIGGWQIKTSLGTRTLGGKISSGSYKLIFNIVIAIPGRSIGKEILGDNGDTVILRNKRRNIVDKVSYRGYGLPWSAWEKNDPRSREFASILPGGSPGFRNWFWMPEVGEAKNKNDYSSFYVKDKPFANIGEIGFIHCEEWRTIRLEQGGEWQVLDKITVADPPEKPVQGRININTASKQVLEALPGIDSTLSQAIINYGNSKKRPFNEIGEILQILLLARLGSNGKDDDKDGYIDEEDEREAIFRSLSNLITTRSNCFTVISRGEVVKNDEIVAERKIKAVIDRGSLPIKIKYYRELSED